MRTSATCTPQFDCHFHTTVSDGAFTAEQVIREAKGLGLKFLACTNHDTIDRDFTRLAKESGIEAIPAAELSVREGELNIHMTVYGKVFSERVDTILDTVNAGRRIKVEAQLEQLKNIGFMLDTEDFMKYWKGKGMNLTTVGNGHIAMYLFPKEEEFSERKNFNLKHYFEITGKTEFSFQTFLSEHLKSTGSNPFGSVIVPEYEPTIQSAREFLSDNRSVRSIAHSHLNYEKVGKSEFVRRVIPLIQSGVINALEIHSTAPADWVLVYQEVARKTGILLTFGSDCHFEKRPGEQKAWLGELNPYVSEEVLQAEFSRFREYLG